MLCHALCPLWAYTCLSLGPLACVVASVPLMDCLDVTACETHLRDVGVCLVHTFLHSMRWWYACLAYFVPPFWLSFLLCVFSCLPTCSCMSLYLLMSSSLIPIILCKFTPVFDTRDSESLIGILFDGTCIIHTQSHRTMDIRSKPTFVLLGHPILFDNMLFALWCITCLFAPVWLFLLVCFFACSLCLIC